MAQYAGNPDVEVNGQSVTAVVAGFGVFKEKALEFLRENGIDDPEFGGWYPQQKWLNAFRSIAEATGDFTLFNIGKKIPDSATFPPEIDTIEKSLSSIDIAYHLNHKLNGEVMFNTATGEITPGIGQYGFRPAEARKIIMECDNPYPCDFDRGIIEAMAEKFKPSDGFVMVEHDDTRSCRKTGGDSCTYIVTW